jgi:hypothetical protein
MSADGATVAAARALGGGRGALSDSSVVPLARGVARAAHLAARSQALCGAAANEKHTSVQPSEVHTTHVSLRVCARVWGARLSRARGARAASAARLWAVRSSVRHSLDGDRVCHYFQFTRLALGTILY